MISQTVVYTPYQGNPNAAQQIVELARRLLGDIPGTELRVGPAIESERTVCISNGKVLKQTTWPSPYDKDQYFKHPDLQRYVREVLRGWKLEGDADVPASAEAFIQHILSSSVERKWARNLCVPDREVLWGGETITLFHWEK